MLWQAWNSKTGSSASPASVCAISRFESSMQNTAGIGDYYNDIDMLKAVGHSACCKQAPEQLHKMSEYVACHCNEGAVADFLDYIENKYSC